jgi:hypothetical protein
MDKHAMSKAVVTVTVEVTYPTLKGWTPIAKCEAVLAGKDISHMTSDHAAKYIAQHTQDSVEDMLEDQD